MCQAAKIVSSRSSQSLRPRPYTRRLEVWPLAASSTETRADDGLAGHTRVQVDLRVNSESYDLEGMEAVSQLPSMSARTRGQ